MLLKIFIFTLSLFFILITVKFIPKKHRICKIISVIILLLFCILSVSSLVMDYRNYKESEELKTAIMHDLQLPEAIRRGIPLRYPDEIPKDPLFQGLFQQGRQYEQEGDYEKAINSYKDIINYWTSPAFIKVLAYNSIGFCYYDQGKFDEAWESFTDAEVNMDKIGDRTEKLNAQVSVFYNLGLVYKALNKFSLARSYFYKALEANKSIEDQFRGGNVLQNLAFLSLNLNKPNNFITGLNNTVQSYQKALKKNTREYSPENYAKIQNNLGNTYQVLAMYQHKAQYCKLAIIAFQSALEIHTKEYFPIDYAILQNNLGVAHRTLAEVQEKVENCQLAIEAYKKALEIRTEKKFPKQYAIIHNNLGNAYQTLAEAINKVENCQLAIESYQKALVIYTKEHFPIPYATIQNNLGNAYRAIAEVKNKTINCQLSIDAFQKALEIRTKEHFPMQYAMTQNNLGAAYRTLAQVKDKAKNCQLAITTFQKALEICTKEHLPIQYAMIQNNLGNAYAILAEVQDKVKNIHLAKEAYQEALKIYKKEEYPDVYELINKNILLLEEK